MGCVHPIARGVSSRKLLSDPRRPEFRIHHLLKRPGAGFRESGFRQAGLILGLDHRRPISLIDRLRKQGLQAWIVRHMGSHLAPPNANTVAPAMTAMTRLKLPLQQMQQQNWSAG
jgi:hypothetical protein